MSTAEEYAELALGYVYAIVNRITGTFDGFIDLPTKNWLRLIAVVGGYIIARPLLVKLGAYIQDAEKRKVEAYEKKEEEERMASKKQARIAANVLRGGGEGEGDKAEATGVVDAGKGGGWFGVRSRKGKKGKKGVPLLSEEDERVLILDAMLSDDEAEDVEDLLTRTE